MSKIVKYCNSCEEGFASKFGFCPNCGKELQAFEMNPVNAASPVESPKQEFAAPAKTFSESLPPVEPETAPILEVPAFTEPEPAAPVFVQSETEKLPVVHAETLKAESVAEPIDAPTAEEISEPAVDEQKSFENAPVVFDDAEPVAVPPEEIEKPKTIAAAAGAAASSNAATPRVEDKSSAQTISYVPDSGFYVTVIEDKNVKQRNVLLLGSLMLVLTIAVGATIFSIFNADLFVGSIDQGDFIASVPALDPVAIDEVPPPKKDNKAGGGGGGGGKEQDEDAAKGRLPPQVKDPITPPSPTIVQLTNPELVMKQQTKGNNNRPITDETTGLPTGLSYNGSSGRGRGAGIGNGFGNGVGNGRGDGEGNGIGSGSGNGIGDSNGDRNGSGSNNRTTPPPPPVAVAVGPTKALNITSKPRASYTDEARKNSVQGTVVLKVTFLASGQIGSISPVSGLPNGLTEQAIAAARQMRFEPAMKNGVAQSVTKSVQFSFTIY